MQKHLAAMSLTLAMLPGGAVIARPWVYVATFPYGAGAKKWLDSAEKS
jgi:hypothetical protein